MRKRGQKRDHSMKKRMVRRRDWQYSRAYAHRRKQWRRQPNLTVRCAKVCGWRTPVVLATNLYRVSQQKCFPSLFEQCRCDERLRSRNCERKHQRCYRTTGREYRRVPIANSVLNQHRMLTDSFRSRRTLYSTASRTMRPAGSTGDTFIVAIVTVLIRAYA